MKIGNDTQIIQFELHIFNVYIHLILSIDFSKLRNDARFKTQTFEQVKTSPLFKPTRHLFHIGNNKKQNQKNSPRSMRKSSIQNFPRD